MNFLVIPRDSKDSPKVIRADKGLPKEVVAQLKNKEIRVIQMDCEPELVELKCCDKPILVTYEDVWA